jgi:hypothetical protein
VIEGVIAAGIVNDLHVISNFIERRIVKDGLVGPVVAVVYATA